MQSKSIAAIFAILWLAGARAGIAADHITYQLGFLPQGSNADVYVGIGKGLFAAENLDVTILQGRGAVDAVTKVSAGVADVGEATLDTVLASAAQKPLPLKAVMPEFTKPPDAIVTTTVSGIVTLKDVTGKKVATAPFASGNLVWPFVLRQNGVDPDSVTLLKADPGVLPAMLATGQVDAILAWVTTSPLAVAAVNAAGKQVRIIPWSDLGYEGYSQSIVASDALIAKRPDVLRRFIKVMRQSIRLVYADPTAAGDVLVAALPNANADVLRKQIAATKPYFLNEITDQDGVGVYTPARIKKSWDWVAKANNLPLDKLDPMTVVDMRFAGS